MADKYQEALDNLYKLRSETYNVHQKHKEWNKEIEKYDAVGRYLEILRELVDKETPKKFEIIDRDLIFHSTPHPTKYYLTIRCSCGGEFGCAGYQHWKVIDKHNVAKDYFEYEYSYCPHCGQKLDWSEEDDTKRN